MTCRWCGRGIDLLGKRWYAVLGQGLYCGRRQARWDGVGMAPGHEPDLSAEAVREALDD